MRSRCIKVLVVCTTLLLLAGRVDAQDLCADLRQASEHAERDFGALKLAQPNPYIRDSYPARIIISGASSCDVSTAFAAAGKHNYGCTMTRANATPEEARATYERDVERVRRCFPEAHERSYGSFIEWKVAPKVEVRVLLTGQSHIQVIKSGSALPPLPADDVAACNANSSQWPAMIAACTRAIQSGRHQGAALADLYYRRCLHNFSAGHPADLPFTVAAIKDCSEAVRLAPSARTHAARGMAYQAWADRSRRQREQSGDQRRLLTDEEKLSYDRAAADYQAELQMSSEPMQKANAERALRRLESKRGQSANAQDDSAALQGTYSATAVLIDGEKEPSHVVASVQVTVKGNVLAIRGLGPDEIRMEYRLNPSASPARMDLVLKSAGTQGVGAGAGAKDGDITPAIYELRKDFLRLSWNKVETRGRPARFESPPGSGLILIELKRQSVDMVAATPAYASAQELCAGLNEAIRNSHNLFENLKSGPHAARRLYPGQGFCTVIERRYGCVLADRVTENRAREALNRYIAEVRQCFPEAKTYRFAPGSFQLGDIEVSVRTSMLGDSSSVSLDVIKHKPQ